MNFLEQIFEDNIFNDHKVNLKTRYASLFKSNFSEFILGFILLWEGVLGQKFENFISTFFSRFDTI